VSVCGPTEKWSDIDSDDCEIANNGEEEVHTENTSEESEFNRLKMGYNRSLNSYQEETNAQFYASPALHQDPNTVPTASSSLSAPVFLGRYRTTPSPPISFTKIHFRLELGLQYYPVLFQADMKKHPILFITESPPPSLLGPIMYAHLKVEISPLPYKKYSYRLKHLKECCQNQPLLHLPH
jgi:hypothetical protein